MPEIKDFKSTQKDEREALRESNKLEEQQLRDSTRAANKAARAANRAETKSMVAKANEGRNAIGRILPKKDVVKNRLENLGENHRNRVQGRKEINNLRSENIQEMSDLRQSQPDDLRDERDKTIVMSSANKYGIEYDQLKPGGAPYSIESEYKPSRVARSIDPRSIAPQDNPQTPVSAAYERPTPVDKTAAPTGGQQVDNNNPQTILHPKVDSEGGDILPAAEVGAMSGDLIQQSAPQQESQTMQGAKDPRKAYSQIEQYTTNPAYPITEGYRRDTADTIASMVDKESMDDFMKYASTATDPNYKKVPIIDEEKERLSARWQRGAKWADMLAGFAEGLRGDKHIDWDNLATSRIAQARDERFKNFRDITEANKETADAWEKGYRNDLLNYYNQQLQRSDLSKAEKNKFEQLKMKIDAEKEALDKKLAADKDNLERKIAADKDMQKAQLNAKKGSTPYSETLHKLSPNAPLLLQEFAKYSKHPKDANGNITLTPADLERYSTTILSQMFEKDADGNITSTVKPGMENYVDEMTATLSAVDQARNKIPQLEAEKRRAVNSVPRFLVQEKERVEKQYDDSIAAENRKLSVNESALEKLFSTTQTDDDITKQFFNIK